jgi:hypothetical protein
MVDLSQLSSLGMVGGIGGIVIGAVVLLIRSLIDKAETNGRRNPLFKTIAIGAFGLGALGIIASVINSGHDGLAAAAIGKGSTAALSGGDTSIGANAATPCGRGLATPGLPTNATATAQGDYSVAAISGGNTTMNTGGKGTPSPGGCK